MWNMNELCTNINFLVLIIVLYLQKNDYNKVDGVSFITMPSAASISPLMLFQNK